MVALILLLVASVGHLWLQYRLHHGWNRVSESEPDTNTPVSIIIAAHNELANLQAHLSGWLNQSHQDFEVIVVLDRCSDGSLDLISSQARKEPRLRFISIAKTPKGWSPKKWALTQGIATARNNLLLFTDADCQVGSQWAATMVGQFEKETDVVLGLSPLRNHGNFMGQLARFESLMTAFLYVGRAGLGRPYMGVGRNLAYRRSWFESIGGFGRFAGTLSGDDDLLINQHAQGDKTAVCLSKSGQTASDAPATFKAWIFQKLRHASVGGHYSRPDLIWLGLYQGLQIGFYLTLGAVFISQIQLLVSLGVFITKELISFLLIQRAIRRARAGLNWYTFGLYDFCYFIFNLFIVPLGAIIKPEWRKREVPKYPKTPSKTGNW